MIVALQTSNPICHVWIDGHEHTWEAGRTLAHGLLSFLESSLKEHGAGFSDVRGLVVFRGPGSFTGLRIGITVMNTIAASESIPIVGATGDRWLAEGRERLARSEDDRIVLPEYGSEAHITKPVK